MWLFDLTPHQLDVLRTLASIAGGIGGFLSGIAVVYSRLAARNAKQAVQQTATRQWVEGKQYDVSVAELTHQAVHNTEEMRGELTHFSNELPRVHGRRRNTPTNQVPLNGDSTYE